MARRPIAFSSFVRGAIVGFVLIWSLFPIVFVVLSSFKPNNQIFDFPPSLIFQPTLSHYADLLHDWPTFIENLSNSLIVTTAATVLATVSSTLAGYVYSRFRGGWVASSALFMVGIRLLPPIVVTLPLFPLADVLGVSDTYFILVFLYAAFFVSLGTMIMKSFIDGIPDELDQAALIDGANEWQILLRIILPIAGQGIVAASIFVVVYSWNEYLFAFIFTTSHAKTAPLLLSEMMSSLTGVDWGVLFAAVTVQLAPVLAFIAALQRYLISGLTAGAIKG